MMWWNKRKAVNVRGLTNLASRRPRCLQVEALEGRLVPATLVSPTVLTYQDVDGDTVTVRISKPVLNSGNVNQVFTFGSNSAQQQLQAINLPATAAGAAVTVTAVRSAANGGNGFANVGRV